MNKLVAAALFLTVLVWVKPAYCWDGVGHMLVAQIAYDRLTPSAKAQVDKLSAALNDDPLTAQLNSDLTPYQPVTIATWPDDIKSLGSETRSFSQWHFIDLDPLPAETFSTTTVGLPALPIPGPNAIAVVKSYVNPSGPDVYHEIIAQSAILRNRSASIADRARALAFVEHFVGDIHQPLHCIGRQRGGNEYVINELPSAESDWPVRNLHSFWDNAYRYTISGNNIVVNPLQQVPRPTTPETGEIKSWADQLVKGYLPSDQRLLNQNDPAAWAAESNEIATSFAFPSDSTASLSKSYMQEAGDIARERIALAGIRLASLLNSLLSSN